MRNGFFVGADGFDGDFIVAPFGVETLFRCPLEQRVFPLQGGIRLAVGIDFHILLR